MKGKIMALVVGVGLYGLTAFGQRDYLYDSDGLKYDLGNASYGGFGNNLCLYNVRVGHWSDTNWAYGTAVIFYDGTYGTMKIFRAQNFVLSYPLIDVIEARYTGAAGTFPGQTCDGSVSVGAINLSFEPIYPMPTFSGRPVLNAGFASGGESVPTPGLPLSAEEDISIPKSSIYRFTASAYPYSFVFYVFSNEVLTYFPSYEGYPATALAMSVDVYYNNTEITTTSGILYSFKISTYQYRTYFTVFPNSAFPVSFSILANYFSVNSQNQLSIFTLAQAAAITVSFLGN